MSPRSFAARCALLISALICSLALAATASASTFLFVEAPNPGSSSIRSDLLALPGVTAVDTFDARSATPTLAQLQAYDDVVTYSDQPYADPGALGDVLADY